MRFILLLNGMALMRSAHEKRDVCRLTGNTIAYVFRMGNKHLEFWANVRKLEFN